MALPDRDAARGWVGKTVVDRDGVEIGPCTAVLADDATGLPEWLSATFGETTTILPIVDAAERGGQVQVSISRIDVPGAPSVGSARHLSQDEEAAIYRHYGIDYSRAASETLLPAGEAEPPASDATRSPVTPPAELTPAPASDDAVPPPGPEMDVVVGHPDETPSTKRSRRLVAIFGAVAGLGATSAAALEARRRGKRRPLTPAERAAQLARAVSVAASARKEQIGASAAPLILTTTKTLRRETQAMAGATRRAASAAPQLAATAASRTAAWATAFGQETVRGGRWAGGAVGSVPEVVSEHSKGLQKGWRKMMSKSTLALGFGAGYVLGARAGRARFEQIKQAAATAAQRPEVQQALDRLKTATPAKLQSGTENLSRRTSGVTAKLRRRHTSTDYLNGAQTPVSPSDASLAVGLPADAAVAQEPLKPPRQANDEPGSPLR